MKKQLLFKILSAGVPILIAGIILWACQKEKYPNTLDAEIAASSEMEAYVVAGYELQAALNEFQKAMNAVDWSQMHWIKDKDGHEVMHLPVQSLTFEAKLNQFNDKKDALQQKYRRIVSCSQEQCERMIRLCLKNSVEVNTQLLNLGMNLSIPTKRPGGPESFDEEQLLDSLGQYVQNPNYVESYFVQYSSDSSFVMFVHPSNTAHRALTPEMESRGGKLYWPGGGRPNDPIISEGHTHRYSATPSDSDVLNKIPIVTNNIFWNGKFHKY